MHLVKHWRLNLEVACRATRDGILFIYSKKKVFKGRITISSSGCWFWSCLCSRLPTFDVGKLCSKLAKKSARVCVRARARIAHPRVQWLEKIMTKRLAWDQTQKCIFVVGVFQELQNADRGSVIISRHLQATAVCQRYLIMTVIHHCRNYNVVPTCHKFCL